MSQTRAHSSRYLFFILLFFILETIPLYSLADQEPRLSSRTRQNNSVITEAVWTTTGIGHCVLGDSPWPQMQSAQAVTQALKDIGANSLMVEIYSRGAIYPSETLEINPKWGKYNGDPLKDLIDECHKNNIEVSAWIWGYMAYRDFEKKNKDGLSVNYKGEPSEQISFHYEKGVAYKKKFLNELLTHYDIDTVMLDEPHMTGCDFSSAAKVKFSKWMENKFPGDSLKKMGYGTMEELWPPLLRISADRDKLSVSDQFLWCQWNEFSMETVTLWCREIASHIKAVSPKTRVRVNLTPMPLVATNAWLCDWRGIASLPEIDILSTDPYVLDFGYPVEWMGLMCRAMLALTPPGKTAMGIPQFHPAWWDVKGKNRRAIINNPLHIYCQVMEPFINGCNGVSSYDWSFFWRDDFSANYNTEKYQKMKENIFYAYSFVRKWEQYYRGYRIKTPVALLLSPETCYNCYYLNTYDYMRHSIWPVYHSLLDSHMTVDILWTPLSADKLSKFKVLILPGVRSMGDSDIAAIKAWVADHGNTLISVGDLPDLNEIGMKSDKKRWDNINDRLFKQITFPERPTAAEAFNFKKGNFISVKKDIVASALPEHYTKQYRDNLDDIHCQPDTKNREYLSAVILKGLSMSHAEPPIEVLNCPEKIEVNFMESKENGNHIIHLLNHGEEKIKNIKIILNSCAGRRPNVFISPDACDAKNMELALLDTVLENGKVSVTVPVLEKYRLVILREE